MKHHTFTTITGLTQEEIAMWLCIPRSQWSMHESGKRNLPIKSVVDLGMLLQEVQNNQRINDDKSTLHYLEEIELNDNFLKEIKKWSWILNA